MLGNSVQVVGRGWIAVGCIFHPVQLIDGLLIPSWHQVAVGIYRDLDAVISHLLLDVGEEYKQKANDRFGSNPDCYRPVI